MPQKYLKTIENKHGKRKALSILAQVWRLSLDRCLVQAEKPRQPVEMKSERPTTAQFPHLRCLDERHKGGDLSLDKRGPDKS
jgi:hypothetical protein